MNSVETTAAAGGATSTERLARWRARVGFGVGGFGVSLIYTTGAVLQLYFYTHVLGIAAAKTGTILFIGALGDALVDPLVGWLASRTRTRWGRYRPYLILGAVPMSLAFIATFANPSSYGAGVFWYALCSLAIFRLSFQLIYMPYTSLIVVMSRDANERSDIESYRAWFIAAGALSVTLGGLWLVNRLGHGNDAQGFFRLACVIGVLTAASLLMSGLATREVTGASPVHDVSNLWEVFKLVSSNDQFLVVVAATVLSQSAYAVMTSSSVTFIEVYWGHRELARWPLVACNAAAFLAAFIWPAINRRHGKRVTWMSGVSLAAVILIILFLTQLRSIQFLVIGFFLVGCGIQAGIITQFAAAADALDYGEWKKGLRTEAVGFALMTCAMKASLAIGNGVVGWSFGAAGFKPGHVPSPRTIEGMRLTFLGIPAAGFFLAAVVLVFYRISTAKHREIIASIDSRQRAEHGEKARWSAIELP